MFGIIATLILSIVSLIMFTQPLYWCYSQSASDASNEVLKKSSVFDFIKFPAGQDILLTIGAIFLILAIVFVSLLILFTFVNLILNGTNKQMKGCKFVALLFFISMLAATILFGIYASLRITNGNPATLTVGYGLLVGLGASFLCLFFAPRKQVEFY